MGNLLQPILVIVIGLIIGGLSPKLLSGTLARLFSIIGWVLTVVGVVMLVLAFL